MSSQSLMSAVHESSGSTARPRRGRRQRGRLGRFVGGAVAALLLSTAGPAAVADAAQAPSVLSAGQTLSVGQSLVSPNARYSLTMQTDGNLVEYGPGGWVWQSNTLGSGGANRLSMQTDGNLVMYTSANGVPFTTATAGAGAQSRLVVQDDGNVVLYGNGGPVFATRTNTERGHPVVLRPPGF